MTHQTVVVQGKALADEIEHALQEEVQKFPHRLVLAIVQIGDNEASRKYVQKKIACGNRIGIAVEQYNLRNDADTEEVRHLIRTLSGDEKITGMIVQLPLPQSIDTEAVLAELPTLKDVDALSLSPCVRSPVVRAIAHICGSYGFSLSGKRIAIVGGRGRLVGRPVMEWARAEAGQVQEIVRMTNEKERDAILGSADMIVSGVGTPALIKPEQVKKNVVLIDAGTSNQSGKLVGDIDPQCMSKASIFSPSPGGVGPLTVVYLFSNLIDLYRMQHT